MPSAKTLRIEQLRFSYPGSQWGLALQMLHLQRGESLALTGPSGSGKSTLLRLMSGLLQPKPGAACHYGDQDLCLLSPAQRRAFQLEKIGFVFQEEAFLDYLTAEENILLPHRFSARPELGLKRDHMRSLAIRLGLHDLLTRRVARLSVGERQRVGIIRALVHRPQWFLADEPTSALDAEHAHQVLDLLWQVSADTGMNVIMATHDSSCLSRFTLQHAVKKELLS
jgi:putative ABC transport system ATP-binding protein